MVPSLTRNCHVRAEQRRRGVRGRTGSRNLPLWSMTTSQPDKARKVAEPRAVELTCTCQPKAERVPRRSRLPRTGSLVGTRSSALPEARLRQMPISHPQRQRTVATPRAAAPIWRSASSGVVNM